MNTEHAHVFYAKLSSIVKWFTEVLYFFKSRTAIVTVSSHPHRISELNELYKKTHLCLLFTAASLNMDSVVLALCVYAVFWASFHKISITSSPECY